MLFFSLVKFFSHCPNRILATGGMIALPIAIWAFFFRVKVVFFECGTRVEDLSLTAKIIKLLHGPIFVQNKLLNEKYPASTKYSGSIY